MRPKVVIIANRLGGFGGGERWVYEASSRLKNVLDLNIINPISNKDVIRVEERKLNKSYGIEDVKITEVRCLGISSRIQGKINLVILVPTIDGLMKLSNTIKNSDIVYEMSFNPFLLISSILFAKIYGKRFILGLHNPDFLIGRSSNEEESGIFSWLMERFLLASVKEMHVQTESQKRILSEVGYTGKIYYIRHYLYFKVDKKEIMTQGNEFVVLFTGRLATYQKGIDMLGGIIDATVSLGKNIKFRIAGSGEGEKIIKSLASKYPNNVKNLGFVSEKQLKLEYRDSSLFILPSRYETPGLSLLEAQSYGLPAIAFNVMGPKDIMKKNFQGMLVKPFDTRRFSSEILKYYELYNSNLREYKELKLKIWKEIGSRYNEQLFIKGFLSMIRKQ